jgi:flagellin
MVSQVTYYLYNLTNVYNRNSIDLGQTLMRLASGKRLQSPSDDLTDYFRSADLDNQYSQYSEIKQNIGEWQSALDIASTAAGEVYNKLQRMKDLSAMYDSAEPDAQAAYTTEYNQLKADVAQIVDLTDYGSTGLLDSSTRLTKIDLVPDASTDAQRLVINPGEAIVNSGGTTHLSDLTPLGGENIGDVGGHIDAAITDVRTYSANVSAYESALQAHSNITDAIMSNTKSVSSLLSGTDDAQEMLNLTQQEIIQQASVAMIMQANLAQKSILNLYQFNNHF